MEFRHGSISLSATDLLGHHDCHHLTNLERAVALGSLERPKSWSPLAASLAERGDAHEKAFVEHLVGSGVEVVRVEGRGVEPEAVHRTLALMEAGVLAIVQGALSNGRWGGRADVLWRVETPSRFGTWSYEAIDAKLSRLTKGNTLLQLSPYSELIGAAQPRSGNAPSCPLDISRHVGPDWCAQVSVPTVRRG
jgi:predicted RecB family nuclease